VRRQLATTLFASLIFAAPASAEVAHTVAPGETLWSIAAANNLTTRTVAAYNGVSEDHQVVLGSVLRVPTVAEGYAALQAAGLVSAPASVPAAAPADATVAPAEPSPAPPVRGGYTVRPGDTLSGLAARSRVPLAQMAYMNGLKHDAMLIAGTPLKLPTGSPVLQGGQGAAPAPAAVPNASPAPSPGRVTGAQVGQIAAEHGVPGSLAAAIGWQESGFNNAMVSSANARGVMQVMPGTWDWVQANLSRNRRLDPSSAADNVRAGSLYLGQLLRETKGDPAVAAAGYYQGLASVRRIGMLPETRRYVANVLALRSRFGG
jgi:N-acetylmuramoyl-L-alanine amidase